MGFPETLMLVLAFPLLAGLLYSARIDSLWGSLATKPFLSALFIGVALVRPCPDPVYFGMALAALLFCLAGDVLLIYTRSRTLFVSALGSFLAGHVLYAIAFFRLASPGAPALAASLLFAIAGGVVFVLLRPYLKSMTAPVAVYVLAITLMVSGAAFMMGNTAIALPGRALAFAGAVLFYISDIFVARQRFVKGDFMNRLIGLPLYYSGQFMIAFSIGAI